jgi:predicted MPP superfamily phosphohydrolase
MAAHMLHICIIYFGMTVIIAGMGIFNANTPKVSDFTINVTNSPTRELRIVEVSDIHITGYTRISTMQDLVERINALDADVVVFVGDIVDGEPEPYIEKDLMSVFRGIKSRHGVYGALGNHEYHGGGVEKAVQMYNDSNIKMLVDDVAIIDELNISIIGRNDYSQRKTRLTIGELVAMAKPESMLLVLDHQPQAAMEAKGAGIDLQLSGHTHNGQIFPVNFIVKFIYDNPWGHKLYDAFNLIVSCGYGTWGPPMRTRSYSEIVVVDVK